MLRGYLSDFIDDLRWVIVGSKTLVFGPALGYVKIFEKSIVLLESFRQGFRCRESDGQYRFSRKKQIS